MVEGFRYNWTSFRKQVFIRDSAANVFLAWATSGGIVQWFIKEAVNTGSDGQLRSGGEIVQPGDRYAWHWHQDLSSSGHFVDVEPDHLLKFTFGKKHPSSEEFIYVTLRLEEVEPGLTRLELSQDNMEDSPEAHVRWHMQCNLGWSFFMTNLKAYLEHRVDLRETDPDRAYLSRAVNLDES
jgi:uncharacterized protein YndB with AHSA1/START domain